MSIIDFNKQIKRCINKASNIFIMGHRDIDLDAIGSCYGMYQFAKKSNKDTFIILDDKKLELGVKKVLEKTRDNYTIVKSKDIKDKIVKKSLLIILDTNKEYLLQNEKLLEKFKEVLIIDHHGLGESSIKFGLKVIDQNTSSVCEMIAELLEYNKIQIGSELATVILSGIVLDTNNYVLKTTANTFKASYYLSKNGADMMYVQYVLKQDLKEYIERQKVITEVKLIKNIAVSKGRYREIYRREDLAKIADTILLFNGMEASFVIGRVDKNTIGISARSMGNIDIGKILEQFGGGGDTHEAAARISNMTLKEVDKEVIKLVNML